MQVDGADRASGGRSRRLEERRRQQGRQRVRQHNVRRPAQSRQLNDAPTRSKLFAALRQSSTVAEIDDLVQRIGTLHTMKEWNMLLQAWSRGRQPHRAAAVLSLMEEKGFSPDVFSFSAAITASLKAGLWEDALRFFDDMQVRQIRPDLICYNATISACGKGKQWQRACDLLRELQRVGLAPDAITYNSTITALAKGGQYKQAQALLDEMRKAGVPPNVVSYSAAISACEKGGAWESALSLLRGMQAAGVAPNVVSYSAAISACGSAGEWAHALALLDAMQAAGVAPNEVAFNSAITACAKGAQWQRALGLLSRMHGAGIAPSAVSYNAAMAACRSGGAWERALDLLQEMREAGVAPTLLSYTAAITACDKNGEWKQALHLLSDLRKAGLVPDLVVAGAVVSACVRAGAWGQALALFGELRDENVVVPDAMLFNAAVDACAMGELWERALELLGEMRTAGVATDVLAVNTVLLTCVRCGQHEPALTLLAEMRAVGVALNAISFSVALSACEKGGLASRSHQLRAEMRADGIQDDLVSLTAEIQALAADSDLDTAFERLRNIQESPLAPGSFAAHHVLLTACRRLGDTRANDVQAAIHRLGLRSCAAVVQFAIDGAERQHVNGTESRALDEAVEELFRRVCEQTTYRPQYEALPLDFVRRASVDEQVRSLKFHAEKKALVSLMLSDEPLLAMSVNIKVCADCHSFLAHASRLCQRSILVTEPARQHTFDTAGICSCDGRGYELLEEDSVPFEHSSQPTAELANDGPAFATEPHAASNTNRIPDVEPLPPSTKGSALPSPLASTEPIGAVQSSKRSARRRRAAHAKKQGRQESEKSAKVGSEKASTVASKVTDDGELALRCSVCSSSSPKSSWLDPPVAAGLVLCAAVLAILTVSFRCERVRKLLPLRGWGSKLRFVR